MRDPTITTCNNVGSNDRQNTSTGWRVRVPVTGGVHDLNDSGKTNQILGTPRGPQRVQTCRSPLGVSGKTSKPQTLTSFTTIHSASGNRRLVTV